MRKIATKLYTIAQLEPSDKVEHAISEINKFKGGFLFLWAVRKYLKDLPPTQIEEALRQLGYTGDIVAFRKRITEDNAPIANKIERVPGNNPNLGNARWQAPRR